MFYFGFEGKLCLCGQTVGMSVPLYCFVLFIPADIVKHSWIIDDASWNAASPQFSLTRLSTAVRGVYISRSTFTVAEHFQ